ncbi:hypothetical protein [Photobacterium atrarenae]|uniref:Uncharacterized protein n=1 Tax=Photobacterium atrarenae TaxID=865757 RepID=A0ABY5GH30_9GAMM|nr:hypothetical protein [Photobacterium atrarenae]UTV28233.1 hypothetical protein NNL38_02760 [Photobacterium atrarenae]
MFIAGIIQRRFKALWAGVWFLILPLPAQASLCDVGFNGQVTLVSVAHFASGTNAGDIVKRKVEVLQGILTGSAFERSSAIEAHLSAYTDPQGQAQLMITLSAFYSGSYDAITALFNHPDHLSVDITQCQA